MRPCKHSVAIMGADACFSLDLGPASALPLSGKRPYCRSSSAISLIRRGRSLKIISAFPSPNSPPPPHAVAAVNIGRGLEFLLDPNPATDHPQTYTRARPHPTLTPSLLLFSQSSAFASIFRNL